MLGLLVLMAGCTSTSSTTHVRTDAPVAATEVALGQKLFFDSSLSSTGTVSCATCHRPERGFADGQVFSVGAGGSPLGRHTPHLFNVGDQKTFFWDGRATSLEEQARMVLENPDEMNTSMQAVARIVAANDEYRTAFAAAYPGNGLTEANITRALAAFVRTIRADNTPFDRYQQGNTTALSAAAVNGMSLFFGRAGCVSCHVGPNLTDGKFHNTGIPGTDRGRATFDRVGEFQSRPYPFFQANKAFKTPSLRNVAVTAPYFHDGSEETLLDVVGFYNQGGKDPKSYGLAADIRPLGLSDSQMAELVAFLEALTAPRYAVDRPAAVKDTTADHSPHSPVR